MSRQPPSYRPNVARNVTRKWVEARQPDYDDGWGDEDERSQSSTAAIASTQAPRGLSFGQDDERRPFASEISSSPSRPLAQYAQSQSTSDPRVQHQHSQPQPVYNNRPLQQYGPTSGPPPTSSTGSRYHGDREQDYQARRSLDQQRPGSRDSGRQYIIGTGAQRVSLDQQRRQFSTDETPLSSYPPRSASQPRSTIGDEKPLPIVRPADIYARMAEEQEKARKSQGTNRPAPQDNQSGGGSRDLEEKKSTTDRLDGLTPRVGQSQSESGFNLPNMTDRSSGSIQQPAKGFANTPTNTATDSSRSDKREYNDFVNTAFEDERHRLDRSDTADSSNVSPILSRKPDLIERAVDDDDLSAPRRAATTQKRNTPSPGRRPLSMETPQLPEAQSAVVTPLNQASSDTTTTGSARNPGPIAIDPANRPAAAVVQSNDGTSSFRRDSEASAADMRSTSEEYRDWARRSRQFNASHGLPIDSPTTPGFDPTEQFAKKPDGDTSLERFGESFTPRTADTDPDVGSIPVGDTQSKYQSTPAVVRMAGVALPGMTRALGVDPLLQSDRREIEPVSIATSSNRTPDSSSTQEGRDSVLPSQSQTVQHSSSQDEKEKLSIPKTSTVPDSDTRASNTEVMPPRPSNKMAPRSSLATRPPLDRDESFRPSIPGGWQSSEHVPQVSSIDEAVEGTTRRASTESIPTATAPRDPNWRSQYEKESDKDPGSALAGAFSGRALTRRDSKASSVSEDDGPTGANRSSTVAARDFAASAPSTVSAITAPAEGRCEETNAPLSSTPSLRRNERSHRDRSPSKDSENWWSDEEDSKSASQDFPPPLRTNRAPDYRHSQTFSQLNNTDQSREQLHDEIVRSLTPKASSVRSEASAARIDRENDIPAIPGSIPEQNTNGPRSVRRADSSDGESSSKEFGRNRETPLDGTDSLLAGSKPHVGRDHHFSTVGGRHNDSTGPQLDRRSTDSSDSARVHEESSRVGPAPVDSSVTANPVLNRHDRDHNSDGHMFGTASTTPLVGRDHHFSMVGGRHDTPGLSHEKNGGIIAPAITTDRFRPITARGSDEVEASTSTQPQSTPETSSTRAATSNIPGPSRSASQGFGYDRSSIYAGYDHPTQPAVPAAVTALLGQKSVSPAHGSLPASASQQTGQDVLAHTNKAASQGLQTDTQGSNISDAHVTGDQTNISTRSSSPSDTETSMKNSKAGASESTVRNPLSMLNTATDSTSAKPDVIDRGVERLSDDEKRPGYAAAPLQGHKRDVRRQDSAPLSPIYSDSPNLGAIDHGSYIDRLNSTKQGPSSIAQHPSPSNSVSASADAKIRPPIPAGLPLDKPDESTSRPIPPAPRRQRSIHSSVTSPVAERVIGPTFDYPARPLDVIARATDDASHRPSESHMGEIVSPTTSHKAVPSNDYVVSSGARSDVLPNTYAAPQMKTVDSLPIRAADASNSSMLTAPESRAVSNQVIATTAAAPYPTPVVRASPLQGPTVPPPQAAIHGPESSSISRSDVSMDRDMRDNSKAGSDTPGRSGKTSPSLRTEQRDSMPGPAGDSEPKAIAGVQSSQDLVSANTTPAKTQFVRFQYNPDRPFPSDKTSYRVISTLPTARERIKALNNNRDAYAEDMGHLEHWLSTIDPAQYDKVLGSANVYTTTSSAQSTPSRMQTRPGFDSNAGGRTPMRSDARSLLNVGKGFLAKGKDRLRTVSAGSKAPSYRQTSNTSSPSTSHDVTPSRNVASAPAPRLPEPVSITPIEDSSFSKIFDDRNRQGGSTLSPISSVNGNQQDSSIRNQPGVASLSAQEPLMPLNRRSSADPRNIVSAAHERRDSGVSDVSSISGIPRADSLAARTVSPAYDHPANYHASIGAATARQPVKEEASDDRGLVTNTDNGVEPGRAVQGDSVDPERQDSQPFSFVHGDSMSHADQQHTQPGATSILDPVADRVTESPLPSARRPPEELAKFRTTPMPVSESVPAREEPYRIPGPYTRELRPQHAVSQTPVVDRPVDQQTVVENPNTQSNSVMAAQSSMTDPPRQAYPNSSQMDRPHPTRPSMDTRPMIDQRPGTQSRRNSFFSRLSGRQSVDQDRPAIPDRRRSRDLLKFGGQGASVDQSGKKRNRLSAIFGGGRSTEPNRATTMPIEQMQYADPRQPIQSHGEQTSQQNMYEETARHDQTYPAHAQDLSYNAQREQPRRDTMPQNPAPYGLHQSHQPTETLLFENAVHRSQDAQYDRPEVQLHTDHSSPSYPTSAPPISAFYSENPINTDVPQSATSSRAQPPPLPPRAPHTEHQYEEDNQTELRNLNLQHEPVSTRGPSADRSPVQTSSQEKPYTISLPHEEQPDQAREARRSLIESTSAPTGTTGPKPPMTVAERMLQPSPAPSKTSSTRPEQPSIHSQRHGPQSALNAPNRSSERVSTDRTRDVSPQRDTSGTQRTQTRRIPATANDHPLPPQLPPHLRNAKQGGTIAELTGSKPDGYESEEEIVMSANARPGMEWQPAFDPWDD